MCVWWWCECVCGGMYGGGVSVYGGGVSVCMVVV